MVFVEDSCFEPDGCFEDTSCLSQHSVLYGVTVFNVRIKFDKSCVYISCTYSFFYVKSKMFMLLLLLEKSELLSSFFAKLRYQRLFIFSL